MASASSSSPSSSLATGSSLPDIDSEPVVRLLRRLVIASGHGQAPQSINDLANPTLTTPIKGVPSAPPPTPASPQEVSTSPSRHVPTHEILRVVEGCGDRQATAKVAGLLKLRSHLRGRVAQLKNALSEDNDGGELLTHALAELTEDIEKTEREVRGVVKDLARRNADRTHPHLSPSPHTHTRAPVSLADSPVSPYTPHARASVSAFSSPLSPLYRTGGVYSPHADATGALIVLGSAEQRAECRSGEVAQSHPAAFHTPQKETQSHNEAQSYLSRGSGGMHEAHTPLSLTSSNVGRTPKAESPYSPEVDGAPVTLKQLLRGWPTE